MLKQLQEIIQSVQGIPTKINSSYEFDGIVVPRVTAILSDMLHEDYLMDWSNYLGLYKHQKYKDVLDAAADKGSYVHNGIEDYIQNGVELDSSNIPQEYLYEVTNAWNSFLKWWEIIRKAGGEVIMQEQELVCQWYGGTLDILLKINDKVYLVDFKTSNNLSYKYCLQLAAYRYMLRTLYGIEVDGVMIVKLNKKEPIFEELVYDMQSIEDLTFINQCETCFHTLVAAYYQRKWIEWQFKERIKEV